MKEKNPILEKNQKQITEVTEYVSNYPISLSELYEYKENQWNKNYDHAFSKKIIKLKKELYIEGAINSFDLEIERENKNLSFGLRYKENEELKKVNSSNVEEFKKEFKKMIELFINRNKIKNLINPNRKYLKENVISRFQTNYQSLLISELDKYYSAQDLEMKAKRGEIETSSKTIKTKINILDGEIENCILELVSILDVYILIKITDKIKKPSIFNGNEKEEVKAISSKNKEEIKKEMLSWYGQEFQKNKNKIIEEI